MAHRSGPLVSTNEFGCLIRAPGIVRYSILNMRAIVVETAPSQHHRLSPQLSVVAHSSGVHCVKVGPLQREHVLATSCGRSENAVCLWDQRMFSASESFDTIRDSRSSRALLCTLQTAHNSAVPAIHFDEFKMVSCSYDGSIALWDLQSFYESGAARVSLDTPAGNLNATAAAEAQPRSKGSTSKAGAGRGTAAFPRSPIEAPTAAQMRCRSDIRLAGPDARVDALHFAADRLVSGHSGPAHDMLRLFRFA